MKIISTLWLCLAAMALAQRDGRADYDRRLDDIQRQLEDAERRNAVDEIIRRGAEEQRRADEAERQAWEDVRRLEEENRPRHEEFQRAMAQEAARRDREAIQAAAQLRVLAEEGRLLVLPLDSVRQRILTERIAMIERELHFLDAGLRSKIIRATRIEAAREQEAFNNSKSASPLR